MGTLADKLAYTKEAVDNIQSAIQEMGVAVDNTVTLAEYPEKIREIEDVRLLHNFTKIKPFYISSKLNGEAKRIEETYHMDYEEIFRYGYNYIDDSRGINRNDNTTEGDRDYTLKGYSSYAYISRERIDNAIPILNGYHVIADQNYENTKIEMRTLKLPDKDYTKNGIPMYNTTKKLIKVSRTDLITKKSDQEYEYKIYKMSDSTGLILYNLISFPGGRVMKTAQYIRMFRVNRDGSIKIFGALTAVGAASASAAYTIQLKSSLRSPNQIMVLIKKNIYDSNDYITREDYSYFALSCNAEYTGTGTGFTQVRTTATAADGTAVAANVGLGNTNTYTFYNVYKLAVSMPGILSRQDKTTRRIDLVTYFGDNRTLARIVKTEKRADELRTEGYVYYDIMSILGRSNKTGSYIIKDIESGNMYYAKYDTESGLFYKVEE